MLVSERAKLGQSLESSLIPTSRPFELIVGFERCNWMGGIYCFVPWATGFFWDRKHLEKVKSQLGGILEKGTLPETNSLSLLPVTVANEGL